MFKTLPAFAAVLATAVLVAASSSPAVETNSVRVSYADLNLASIVGRNTLERRVAGAARTVCVIEDSRELALARATNQCRSNAVADARPAVDAAIAAARHGSVTVLGGAALIISAR